MKTPAEERETIIRYYENEKTASVYTSSYRMMAKLDKMVAANPVEWKVVQEETCQGDVVGKFYECPVKFISFRSKSVQQNLTEEQKAERVQRMRTALLKSQN